MVTNAKEFDADAVVNPSTGILAKNPTRLGITEEATSQQGIAKAIKGSQQRFETVEWQYGAIDVGDAPPMSGILNIRSMTEDQLHGFFKSLMRCKHNIVTLHIKLGEYDTKRAVNNQRSNTLNSNVKRFPTEIAEKMADLFNDSSRNIVELLYTVELGDNEYFSASAEVFEVDQEQYEDDSKFSPAIGIKYIPAN